MGVESKFRLEKLMLIFACCAVCFSADRIGTADVSSNFIYTEVSKCPPGTFKKDLYCVKNCAPGTYGNIAAGACLPCSKSCKTCLDGTHADRCTSCYDNYFLTDNTCTLCEDRRKQGPPSRKLRLVSLGNHNLEGRVEVLRDMKWGTICDDGWDINDANVVCRELLLGSALAAVTLGKMGTGREDQPIWLSNMKCLGNESRIDTCEHAPWGVHGCGHFEDVGVICSGPDSTRRCVSKCGAGYYAIKNSDQCGVCNPECLTCTNTSSSCTGCDGTTFLEGNRCVSRCKEGFYGDSKTRVCQNCDSSCRTCLDSPKKCTGCADDRYLSNTTCVKKCSVAEVGQKRFIRLNGENRKSSFEGRVEVFRSGEWSTVCDESWDFREATVVCRQLNMGRAIRATTGGHFGTGTGRIWYDKLKCNGSESSIFKCDYDKVVWNSRCYHVKDAGVVCSGSNNVNPLTNICVKRCKDGFYKDQSDVCRPCSYDRCATCIGFPTQCISCASPKFLKSKNCVTDCGDSKYGHTPTRTCKTCDKKCVTCADGKDGKNCTSCSAPLTLKDGKCTDSCKPDLYQHKGKCIKNCPIRFYKYEVNSTCMACPKECFSCTYDTANKSPKCILCKPPLVSDNGKCASNCSAAGKISLPVSNVTGSVTVRLVNGSDHLEGLVQIYHDGIWGTICDDGWDFMESKVLCKQLNLGTQSSKPLSNIPKGTGKIWLDDMFCTGRESALEQCGHRTWGDTNCNHNEDVIVRCSGPGVRTCQNRCPSGYFNNTGECKLCDPSCDICVGNATNCAKCASSFYKNGSACVRSCGKGYFLDATKTECKKCNETCATCSGAAFNCTSCDAPFYRFNSRCVRTCDPLFEPRGTFGVRLAGTGKDSLEGRIEILHNNVWGTICDDGWDIRDAMVACRMLNLGNATVAVTTARFGAGKGRTWLDDVDCTGNENSLAKCGHRGWGMENCEHSEDAGVRCSGPDHSRDCLPACGDGYFYNNKTCGKCSAECKTCDTIPYNCKTCEPNEFLNRSSIGNTCVQDCGDGFYADITTRECKNCSSSCMTCLGEPYNCTSCESAKVLDTETNRCVDSCKDSTLISGVDDIRLAGTNRTMFGRLEVKYNGEWGTVCDDGFDEKDADVACRQLKLGKHLSFKRSAFYGPGVGRVLLDDLQCKGTEKSLFNCRMNPGGIGHANCGHSEDVGVQCQGPDTSKRCIRTCPKGFFKNKNVCLKCSSNCQACIGSSDKCTECRPQLFLEGTKCVSKCTLGWYGNTKLGKCFTCHSNCQTCIDGTRDDFCKTCKEGFFLRDSVCIKECGPGMWSADSLLPPRPPNRLVRLVGGKTKQEGRVEVLHEGIWGTVCDDQWDLNDASVVCRELGFGKALKASVHSEFGKGKGIVWMDNVNCYGYETSITQCRQNGWGINNCDSNHNEDAGVVCDNTTIEDVANNYCRQLLPLSCQKDSPCFPGVTCVDRDIFSGKTQSFCKQCPDKFTGDGRVCRVVSSVKPEFDTTMPPNIIVIAGKVISLRCVAKKGESTPSFNAMIQDWAKDGKPLDPMDINSKRILVSSGQLLIHNSVLLDSGNYSCTLNNTAGTTTGYTRVIIIEIPEIKASHPVLANSGATAYLTCLVSSYPSANITWKRSNVDVRGNRYVVFRDNYTLAIQRVTFDDAGDYECHVANDLGKAMSTIKLTVGREPKFTIEPSDQTSGKGESKTLRCEASGIPQPSITWKRDGNPVALDDNHVITSRGLMIKRVQTEDIGFYACIAKNPQKIITSFAAIILIGPPIIDIPPANMSVLSGANVTFYCQVLASPDPDIEWRQNGRLVAKQKGNARVKDSFTVFNVQPNDAGKITCIATNMDGTVSKDAFLSVDGQTGVYKLATKSKPKDSPLSTGAIVAIVVILVLIILVILGVILYRYCTGQLGRRSDTSCVRYELGSDSGKPDRLTALKYKIRPTAKGIREPVDMYDDIKPFADHDTL